MKYRWMTIAGIVLIVFFVYRYKTAATEDMMITRGQTAQMLFAVLTDDGVQKQDMPLIDVDSDLWCAEAIAVTVRQGVMSANGNLFESTRWLTWQEAAEAASKFQISVKTHWYSRNKPIPLTDWLKIYDQICIGHKDIVVQQFVVQADALTDNALESWQVKTGNGEIWDAKGLTMTDYVGKNVTAYCKHHQILMVIPLTNGQVSEIYENSEKVQSELTKETMVTEQEMTETELQNATAEQKIRVGIMTTDFQSIYHEKITLMADEVCHINGNEENKEILPGETVTFLTSDFKDEDDTLAITADKGGKIQVLTVERANGCPSYEETLFVVKKSDGLCLVNELSVEKYLYGVLTSEMPISFETEALKAQAICARSYAYKAILSPKYDFADVDDSTGCQVYMNQAISETACHVIDSTAGKVMLSHGELAEAKYFSTSCGTLSAATDVWLYPQIIENTDFLVAGVEAVPKENKRLSDEDTFENFIDQTDKNLLEADEPWFRWQLHITMADVRRALAAHLKQRMQINPKHFVFVSDNGEIDYEDFDTINITNRTDSGLVNQICLKGEKQTLKINGEYNIRLLLANPDGVVVSKNDGSESTMQLLPSAYFYIKDDEGGLTIAGGGYGHGCGMSQNGANQLAKLGWDAERILKYYFKNISIENY